MWRPDKRYSLVGGLSHHPVVGSSGFRLYSGLRTNYGRYDINKRRDILIRDFDEDEAAAFLQSFGNYYADDFVSSPETFRGESPEVKIICFVRRGSG